MDEVALTGEVKDDHGPDRRRKSRASAPRRKVDLLALANQLSDSQSTACLLHGAISNLELLLMTVVNAQDRRRVLRVLKTLKKIKDRSHASYVQAKVVLTAVVEKEAR